MYVSSNNSVKIGEAIRLYCYIAFFLRSREFQFCINYLFSIWYSLYETFCERENCKGGLFPNDTTFVQRIFILTI